MKAKIFIFSMLALIFTGCGDSNIDIVKKATLNYNKTMTIGVAIDGFKDCKSVKWEDTSKDGQNIVTATCEVKEEILKDEFQKADKKYQEAVKKGEKEYDDRLKKSYERFADEIKVFSKNEPQIPSFDEVIEMAIQNCKTEDKSAFFKSIECDDDKTNEALKKFGYEPKGFNKSSAAYSLISVIRAFNSPKTTFWIGEVPKEIKSRTYKINFFVNTDKSVDFKNAIAIEDGKEINNNSILYNVYKR